jgi:hypothetical protein
VWVTVAISIIALWLLLMLFVLAMCRVSSIADEALENQHFEHEVGNLYKEARERE